MKISENKPQKTGWLRLLELAFMKKGLIIISTILSSLASVISFVPYIAIYFIIREVLSIYPDYSAINTVNLTYYGWLALLGVIENILLYFFALICSHLAAFGTLYELKVNFSNHLAKVPLGFHIIVGSGKLRKIMDENIEKIEQFIAHQLPDIVAAIVAPIVMIVILMSVDWRYGLVSILGIVIAFIIQFLGYGNDGAQKMMKSYQSSLEEMNNATVEYVRGISVVKAFKQTVYSFSSLHKTIKAYTDMVIPYTLKWENYMSAYTTIINNIYLFIIPVGIFIGMNSADYRDFAGDLIFYIIFVPSIASVMLKIMYVSSNGMQIIRGVEAMDEYLSKPPLSEPSVGKHPKNYDIHFENVEFSYDKDKKALKGISFAANQGEVTAIVGPSGGGKSTIAHLIPRFFDVDCGSVQLGNVDIREIKTEELMEKVSFVFQDVFLFKQSVLSNIRMGNLKATDEQIIDAAKAAQCHEFIMQLPNGYDTVIGAKGVHLSGGEKQRVAIARAIVKDAPVVVLDEATAFSDPENEHLIQKAFEKLMYNKTVVMIAHRLNTIRSADKIVVVSGGEVIQEGTHNELVVVDGKYKDMWNTYTQTISWSMKRKVEGGEYHA